MMTGKSEVNSLQTKTIKTDEKVKKYSRVSMVNPRVFSPKSVDPFAKNENINLFIDKKDALIRSKTGGAGLRLGPGQKSYLEEVTESE